MSRSYSSPDSKRARRPAWAAELRRVARERVVVGVCALVLAGSGVTVAVRDWIDPFAALALDDRLAVADRFVRLGDCPAAIAASRRALQIGRQSSHARVVEAQILARCGR